jgi:dienelactone hydrolase
VDRGVSTAAAPPRFVLEPQAARMDEPVRIRLTGLAPESTVRIALRAEAFRAEAAADFRADAAGVVDLSTDTPLAGDYGVPDAMGLFWAARFDPGAGFHGVIESLARLAPLEYTLRATADEAAITSVRFVRSIHAPGVLRSEVRDGRLRGTYFAPAGATACPAVLVVGGSDGGNYFRWVAALFAAHGFAALGLSYFAEDDLPAELVEIPLEYFAEAITWLRGRKEVGGRRVGVIGPSRGGELVLLLGATVPEVAAVAALAPSSLSGGGVGSSPVAMTRSAWTLDGKPLPMVPPRFDAEAMRAFGVAMATGAPMAMMPGFRRLLANAGADVETAAIPVERIRGPILLLSGGDDQVWPSSHFAEMIVARLRAKGFAYPVEHLSYPHAGHTSSFPPCLPTSVTWWGHPQVPLALEMGGSPRANAEASADAWPRIVAFFRQHLPV